MATQAGFKISDPKELSTLKESDLARIGSDIYRRDLAKEQEFAKTINPTDTEAFNRAVYLPQTPTAPTEPVSPATPIIESKNDLLTNIQTTAKDKADVQANEAFIQGVAKLATGKPATADALAKGGTVRDVINAFGIGDKIPGYNLPAPEPKITPGQDTLGKTAETADTTATSPTLSAIDELIASKEQSKGDTLNINTYADEKTKTATDLEVARQAIADKQLISAVEMENLGEQPIPMTFISRQQEKYSADQYVDNLKATQDYNNKLILAKMAEGNFLQAQNFNQAIAADNYEIEKLKIDRAIEQGKIDEKEATKLENQAIFDRELALTGALHITNSEDLKKLTEDDIVRIPNIATGNIDIWRLPEETVGPVQEDFQFIKGTDDQPGGIFNATTGKFTPMLGTADGRYDPITGAPTDPSKVIDGYDFTSYATDPNWGNAVGGIYNNIKENLDIQDSTDIDNYIQSKNPNSLITGADLIQIENESGVPVEMMMSILQHESNFGSSNVAMQNNNFGGITWNSNFGEDMKGTARPSAEGGNYVKFKTAADGLRAVAGNISRRKLAVALGEASDVDKNIMISQIGKMVYGTRISDAESERIQSIIDGAIKENPEIDMNGIRDKVVNGLLGFKLSRNEDLGSKLLEVMTVNAPEDGLAGMDVMGLGRLLNEDKKISAINKVENVAMREAQKLDPTGYIGESTAKTAVTRADDLITFIDDMETEPPIGIVEGTMENWLGSGLRDKNAQAIRSKIISQVAEMRKTLSGTAVTPEESKFLEPLIPDLGDSPDNFMTKLNQLRENPLVKLNSVRDTVSLPSLTFDSLINKDARLGSYVEVKQPIEDYKIGTQLQDDEGTIWEKTLDGWISGVEIYDTEEELLANQ